MHCLTRKVLILCCFLTISLCRPPTTSEQKENDERETDYERDGESAVDDDDSRLDREEAMEEEQVDESRSQMRNIDNRPARTNSDTFSEYKLNKHTKYKYEDSMNPNSDYQSHSQRLQSNTNIENNDANDQVEASQRFTNPDVNNYKPSRVRNEFNKETNPFRPTSSDEGETLYENKGNRQQLRNFDKREFSNEDADSREQSRYFKEFCNTMEANKQARREEKKTYENAHFYLNRDRRETQDLGQKPGERSHIVDKQNFGDTVNDDEESAIKQHVKNLSRDELKELLNSLSDDKKALLNKIMENDHNSYENVNKREITKKVGDSEENVCVEDGILDLRKVQEDSLIAHDFHKTENTKQPESDTEIADISNTKNADRSDAGDNKAEPSNISEIGNTEKTKVSLNDGIKTNFGSIIQITSKNENKREANSTGVQNTEMYSDTSKLLESEFNEDDSQKTFDDGYSCNQNDEFSQLMEEQADLHRNDGNLNKREIFLDNQIDVNELKSLEESFPNSNTCEESGQYLESDMVPLVRVKRKNEDLTIQKRAAGLLPDAKVAYLPYRADNDDEDNEEGNEYDDEGFYDRTLNIAHINEASKPKDIMLEESKPHLQSKYSEKGFDRSENLESDTMSIGSDSDSVLSGVEGVDDNLMFSSVSRSGRAIEDKPLDIKLVKLNRPQRSTPLIDDEMKFASENHINAPNYQENDAFGALPKNYETDLSRFKRIRCLKPSRSDVSPIGA